MKVIGYEPWEKVLSGDDLTATVHVEVAAYFYHAEQSYRYLNANYVEEKAYSTVRFRIPNKVVLGIFA